MNTINPLRWRFMSNEKKLAHLRKLGLKIGKDCEILNGFNFGSEPYLVEIGDHVRITAGVRFSSHDGGVWVLRGLKKEFNDIDRFGRITIGNNCHIGMNALIMPGVSIGNNCIIGAGAIVTKDVPSNSVAVGIPAKVIESIEDYERKNCSTFLHTKNMSWEEKRRYLQSPDVFPEHQTH